MVPYKSCGVVDETEGVLCGFLDGDHEAHAVGPRLGNGAFVYLNEIGSMYRQSWPGRTSTVRRWISRFNHEGMAGWLIGDGRLSGSPRSSLSPALDPARIWRYLGHPQVSTLYRRVRRVAIWRRLKLTARGNLVARRVRTDKAGRRPLSAWRPPRSVIILPGSRRCGRRSAPTHEYLPERAHAQHRPLGPFSGVAVETTI